MSEAADLAQRLARDAEGVCRHYLSNGRRQGRYWLVGDVDNTPGRSLFVRLAGASSGKGAAGKWSDAATGEHGDLLDLIAANRKLNRLSDAIAEAHCFLRLPRREPSFPRPVEPAPQGSPEAARRLWAIAQPIAGTLAETYLRSRGITRLGNCGALRFHPRCWYRGDPDAPGDCRRDAWPALIAAVRDEKGNLTGTHRTWLDLDGRGKAPVSTPRRAMGHLLGHGVHFGLADDTVAAGEGIETMLSLREVAPHLPITAALSANHLAALLLPQTLRRLYVVRDDDPAGRCAVEALATRARTAGIETVILASELGDLNDDLRLLGRDALLTRMRMEFAPNDVARFLPSEG